MYKNDVAQEAVANVPALAGPKVLVADAHYLVREGLKSCLKSLSQDACVLEAETLESAIETFHTSPDIDLVLLDLAMTDPGSQGRPVLDEFVKRCPGCRLVVVSDTHDTATVQSAFGKGVVGFIPKLANRAAFVDALRFVLKGGTYIPSEALLPHPAALAVASPASAEDEAVPETAGRAAALRGARLTARQIDVLAQLLDGKPNKQICRELNLALGTVKCHVGAILGALEVSSRAEAIAAANKRGWREWLAQPGMEIREAA